MSTRPTPTPSDFVEIGRRFALRGEVLAAAPYGSGHINDTFVVNVSQAGAPVRYIFQRINDRIFKDIPNLMENIVRVTSHQRERLLATGSNEASRRALSVIPSRDGEPWVRDQAGGWWRAYLFIEGASTHDRLETPAQAREGARAFGEFQRLLADMPGGRLHETIPGFHDTPSRYAALERAIDAAPPERLAEARDDISFARSRAPLARRLTDLLAAGLIPERVTHNDTKINNVMLDHATGEGVCVIDLDTVMPGSSLYDFGDLARFATNSALEDETDLGLVDSRPEIFRALVEGYLDGAGAALTAVERAHLAVAGQVMTYEVGIRFLADHLAGDVYFKIKRPGHNLDRARNQFALLRSMEEQQSHFEAIVDTCHETSALS